MAKYVVRYGVMRLLGVFSTTAGMDYRRGTKVIARTDRGLEAAEILCEATPAAVGCLKEATEGQILRAMTTEDGRELARIQDQAHRELEICQQCIERLKLSMQLVDVERVFGGERVVIYYLAESRVDFRELVKLLAAEFQTRIEMRQIGVRDEAKLLADYGDCGIAVCCNTHLVVMPPVSMKMAKLQKATLDPTKISGRCGRLKCCLRYEYDSYEQAQRERPPVPEAVAAVPGAVPAVPGAVAADVGGPVPMVVEPKPIPEEAAAPPRAAAAADPEETPLSEDYA
jgi:cell fate regulator YaaT (PSP1 superfamily)